MTVEWRHPESSIDWKTLMCIVFVFEGFGNSFVKRLHFGSWHGAA